MVSSTCTYDSVLDYLFPTPHFGTGDKTRDCCSLSGSISYENTSQSFSLLIKQLSLWCRCLQLRHDQIAKCTGPWLSKYLNITIQLIKIGVLCSLWSTPAFRSSKNRNNTHLSAFIRSLKLQRWALISTVVKKVFLKNRAQLRKRTS